MTLRGIDVSSWQGDIDPAKLGQVQFCIAKATEGLTYVNPYCDKVVQRCIKAGLPWGFYHYAKSNDPISEADAFIKACENYFGDGIPVLDWEEGQSVDWVNKFVRRVYDKKKVWPWIYSNPRFFNQGGVESNCGRWIAWYPSVSKPSIEYNPGSIPKTEGTVCAWQFASDGQVNGYSGNLDVSIFYGDEVAWNKYAGKTSIEQPSKVSVLENSEYKVTVEKK